MGSRPVSRRLGVTCPHRAPTENLAYGDAKLDLMPLVRSVFKRTVA
jgi:hypothetical protein